MCSMTTTTPNGSPSPPSTSVHAKARNVPLGVGFLPWEAQHLAFLPCGTCWKWYLEVVDVLCDDLARLRLVTRA